MGKITGTYNKGILALNRRNLLSESVMAHHISVVSRLNRSEASAAELGPQFVARQAI